MRKVLVLGAGRSSPALIEYLLNHAAELNIAVTVGDKDAGLAAAKLNGHPRGSAIAFDADDSILCRQTIASHDLVISLLPPHLHILAARECIRSKKNLITASYLNRETELLAQDAQQAGILLLYEMGLDPGIDHMSAMKMIHEIQDAGGDIISFKSATGGLVAPDYDNNPWHYKVTWNPRNVVLAGQGTAQYLENGVRRFVPYHRLFTTTESFVLKGLGTFESYPNRDSLQYISKYGLDGAKTIIRSTLRRKGFCEAWNALVQLGLTDDTCIIENADHLSYAQWVSSYLPGQKKREASPIDERVTKFLGQRKKDGIIRRLRWLGLFSDEKIPMAHGTSAQLLQDLIERKWVMNSGDKDMIVMRHEVQYSTGRKKQKKRRKVSTLVVTGDNSVQTAMAKTVGLPMAIMAKLLLQRNVSLTGLHIPVMPEVYLPVLQELESLNIKFDHKTDSD